jgi:uncharacterized protein YnzC (UPF0291/DUF896 family)
MDQNKIDRINELAKKSKLEGLTEEEKQEQSTLRTEYIKNFRKSLRSTLDSCVIVDEEGNRKELKQVGNKKKN